MKISAMKADAMKSVEGIWFDWEQGVRLRIASANSVEYQMEMERLALERADANVLMNPDAVQKDMRTAAASYLLLEWENLEDDDGNAIPYSEAQALEWLLDKECFELYRFVRDKANEASNFRKEAVLAGN